MNIDVKRENSSFITKYLSKKLYSVLMSVSEKELSEILEIRAKVNCPLIIRTSNGLKFISKNSVLTTEYNDYLKVTAEDLKESFEKICEYSVYSHESEIKNGFITVKGGHRIGFGGTAVIKDGNVASMKNISSLNIRIAREITGIANELLSKISYDDLGILIVGPPSSGKTTLLRDIARQISFLQKKCVTILDERNEIAATYNGIPSNDVGLCDVLNGYPKKEGILQALRTLSPEIIICDEMGGTDDTFAVTQGLNAGVKIISSLHASGPGDFIKRPQALDLLSTGAFKKIVFLQNCTHPAQIKEIIKVEDLYAKSYRSNHYHFLRYGFRNSIRK